MGGRVLVVIVGKEIVRTCALVAPYDFSIDHIDRGRAQATVAKCHKEVALVPMQHGVVDHGRLADCDDASVVRSVDATPPHSRVWRRREDSVVLDGRARDLKRCAIHVDATAFVHGLVLANSGVHHNYFATFGTVQGSAIGGIIATELGLVQAYCTSIEASHAAATPGTIRLKDTADGHKDTVGTRKIDGAAIIPLHVAPGQADPLQRQRFAARDVEMASVFH